MITFSSVSKTFQKAAAVTALSEVSFQIREQEIVGIIGESGAGKSTLLKLLNGIEIPTSGDIWIDDQHFNAMASQQKRSIQQSICTVFQDANLLGNLTLEDNVSLPLKLQKVKRAVRQTRAHELLSFVGLEGKATRYPREISGGERQRAGIARALAREPKFILCDEPTSSLDQKNKMAMINLLQSIHQQTQTTIIIVTHELDVVKALCSRVLIIDQGRLVDDFCITPQTQHHFSLNYAEQAKEVLL